MRVSVSVGSAYYAGEHWSDLVDYVRAADRLDVNTVWSAEAWGLDAVSSIGYLAAVTDRIRLGTGIMQISARTPAATALTALSLAQLSDDRFSLGLGVSGPQVVEGLHGAAFDHPLGRLREYVEIVRMGLRGERFVYDGQHYVLPRPGGEGKALKSSVTPRPDLPIYLATLGPKSLELTGELADGWLGTSLVPEHAEVLLDPIRRGAERSGRSLTDIDLQVNAYVVVSDDVDSMVEIGKGMMAFTLGAMGSAQSNFYNDAYSRAGYADVCAEVQRLWVNGDKAAATAAVPADLVLSAYPIGTEQMVRDRVRAYDAAGIGCLRIAPMGSTPTERIEHLEMVMDMVASAATS